MGDVPQDFGPGDAPRRRTSACIYTVYILLFTLFIERCSFFSITGRFSPSLDHKGLNSDLSLDGDSFEIVFEDLSKFFSASLYDALESG